MRSMRWRRAVAAGALAVALAACGGGSSGSSPGGSTKAAWTAEHAEALATLTTELETARATLSSLQRPDILGTCTLLRDSLGEARKGLPVPDPRSDAALRASLDAVATGTTDCIEGARGPDIPRLEKSFRELREARTLIEVATRTIDAWT